MKVGVRQWAAWAPGLETREDWQKWSVAPKPLEPDGVPDAKFLPAMLRRRCTPLTRIMLKVAYECCDESTRGEVRTVFVSRHGSINESIKLLENVVRRERLSPAIFSHTVHNAQAGLFSIASGNQRASSSLAGREDSFAAGVLEAMTHLERDPEARVLLVIGDVPLAETFASLIEEPETHYGVALLLGVAGGEPGFEIAFEPSASRPAVPAWPDAVEFLRFWLSSEESVEIPTPRLAWRFSRV